MTRFMSGILPSTLRPAKLFQSAPGGLVATEGRAGVADTTLSAPTEGKPVSAYYWDAAVEGW